MRARGRGGPARLLIRCEVAPGQAVVTEDPTFPGALDAIQRSGARPVGVPPGDVARLADALTARRPALAYLVPSFRNPTGLLMPATERHELIGLARHHPDVTFVDDMTLAELPLGFTDGPAPPPLAPSRPGCPTW